MTLTWLMELAFRNVAVKILGTLTHLSNLIKSRQDRRAHLIEQRSLIDESRVKTLTEDIARAAADLTKRDREQAVRKHDLEIANSNLEKKSEEYRKLETKATLSDSRKSNAMAGTDLAHLVGEVIRDLEVDHVHRVAEIMSARFLEIVGSDPEIDSAIFGSVAINDDSFDIEVRTPQGSRLDFDAEINGASQRALTLSFIWALMEVAEVEAPRIIDTPLGMVAGSGKDSTY